eukprot:sb/3460329/
MPFFCVRIQMAEHSERGGKRRKLWIAAGCVGCVAASLALAGPFITPALRKHVLPYVPATETTIDLIFKELRPTATSRLIDLGSGDGRVVIEAAKKGFPRADGIELNIWLVLYSRWKSLVSGTNSRTSFKRADLWKYDLSPYDTIVVFGGEGMIEDIRGWCTAADTAPSSQDSSWLYEGATKPPEGDETKSSLDANATEFVSKFGNGVDSGASESEEESDDDIEITIGEINKKAPGPYGMSFPQQSVNQPKVVSVITALPPTIPQVSAPVTVTSSKRTIDVNAVGNINGVPIYDYDIDTMCEEKPWRLPGADLTDYFNYGFNEDSWKSYCDKQKSVRGIAAEKNREFAVLGRLPALPELPKAPGLGGSIGVIGAKKEMPTQVMSSLSAVRAMMSTPMGMFAPTSFLPIPPQLAPPGLAPLEMMREVKQEDGAKPVAFQHPLSMAGPLPPPTMFPPPGMPSMLPPPGGAIAPPLLLPPPAFGEDSNGGGGSSDEDGRRRPRRRSREHSSRREGSSRRRTADRSTEHRSRSRRSPTRKSEKKSSRKSSRGDESSRRESSRSGHRDEERGKRSKRKKDSEGDGKENGIIIFCLFNNTNPLFHSTIQTTSSHHLLYISSGGTMPKKFGGENSKAVEARARKNAIAEEKKAVASAAAEDERWEDDDKQANKKQQRKKAEEAKRLAALERKKQNADMLAEEEQQLQESTKAKVPPKKITQAELVRRQEAQAEQEAKEAAAAEEEPIHENLNRVMTDTEVAQNVEQAIAALDIDMGTFTPQTCLELVSLLSQQQVDREYLYFGGTIELSLEDKRYKIREYLTMLVKPGGLDNRADDNDDMDLSTDRCIFLFRPALPELPKAPGLGGSIGVIGAKKEMPTQVMSSLSAVRAMMSTPMGMFAPTSFLPIPPQLAPPGLAPLEMMREVKQEDGAKPVAFQHPLSMAGPLPPPTMFPPPGMPSMLPPPGGAIAPPLLLPPPAFGEDSNGGGGSSDEDGRRRPRRRSREHSSRREGSSRRRTADRSTEHRSRSRRSPTRKSEKKSSRKSSRGDESSRRESSRSGHRDEERGKRKRDTYVNSVSYGGTMPKKFVGENSKAVEARARKNAIAEEKKAVASAAAEDERWEDDDKQANKKQQRKKAEEAKRLAALERKKQNADMLAEEEQQLQESTKAKVPPKKITQAELVRRQEAQAEQEAKEAAAAEEEPIHENLNRVMTDTEVAQNVEQAIAALDIGGDGTDMHPEKRMKAAWTAFEEGRISQLRAENPSLRLLKKEKREICYMGTFTPQTCLELVSLLSQQQVDREYLYFGGTIELSLEDKRYKIREYLTMLVKPGGLDNRADDNDDMDLSTDSVEQPASKRTQPTSRPAEDSWAQIPAPTAQYRSTTAQSRQEPARYPSRSEQPALRPRLGPPRPPGSNDPLPSLRPPRSNDPLPSSRPRSNDLPSSRPPRSNDLPPSSRPPPAPSSRGPPPRRGGSGRGGSSRGEFGVRGWGNKEDIPHNLKPVNWGGVVLKEIFKELYKESPATSDRGETEIIAYRDHHSMTVTEDSPRPVLDIEEISFPQCLKTVFRKKGYDNPTPIQSQVWPIALSGKDLIGIAQTGSGKTLGYLLPALLHITAQPPAKEGPIALCLCPTRELAQQVMSVSEEFASAVRIRALALTGGASKNQQLRSLADGAELVIATPGRLIELLDTKQCSLRDCSYVILDEADRLLDMGFEQQITAILSQIRPDRQTLMLSATWPVEVQDLAGKFLQNPLQITLGSEGLVANHAIKQVVMVLEGFEKFEKLKEPARYPSRSEQPALRPRLGPPRPPGSNDPPPSSRPARSNDLPPPSRAPRSNDLPPSRPPRSNDQPPTSRPPPAPSSRGPPPRRGGSGRGGSSRGEFGVRGWGNKEDIPHNLKPVNWGGVVLKEIFKELYKESPATSDRGETEIIAYRDHHSMTVTEDSPRPVLDIEEISFPQCLKTVFRRKGYDNPTPIQSQVWPIALSGKDLIGIAQTGSGKTLGYLLPALLHITAQPPAKEGPIALCLCPTRELAQQVMSVSEEFASAVRIRALALTGPRRFLVVEASDRLPRLEVIATPGRLIELLDTKQCSLRDCSYVILDEADRLLDMGFEQQITAILSQIRPDRQTLMLSATWPVEVQDLAGKFLQNPLQITLGSEGLVANHAIKQVVMVLEGFEKFEKLKILLKQIREEGEANKTLVFTDTKKMTDDLAEDLKRERWPVEAMHGDKRQSDREHILERFKRGSIKILIATDVASRGIDISDITNVINYDYPNTTEDYIHRIGRTARAARSGTAYTFITPNDSRNINDLINVLQEADQEVPHALLMMRECFGGTKQVKKVWLPKALKRKLASEEEVKKTLTPAEEREARFVPETEDDWKSLYGFKRGSIKILIATDVASRGIDISDITNVINYDYPNTTEDYIHRIGRTARAARSGTAYTFITPNDSRNINDLINVLQEADQEVPHALLMMRECFGGTKQVKKVWLPKGLKRKLASEEEVKKTLTPAEEREARFVPETEDDWKSLYVYGLKCVSNHLTRDSWKFRISLSKYNTQCSNFQESYPSPQHGKYRSEAEEGSCCQGEHSLDRELAAELGRCYLGRGLVTQFPLHCGHAKTCLTFAMPYSYQGRGVVMRFHNFTENDEPSGNILPSLYEHNEGVLTSHPLPADGPPCRRFLCRQVSDGLVHKNIKSIIESVLFLLPFCQHCRLAGLDQSGVDVMMIRGEDVFTRHHVLIDQVPSFLFLLQSKAKLLFLVKAENTGKKGVAILDTFFTSVGVNDFFGIPAHSMVNTDPKPRKAAAVRDSIPSIESWRLNLVDVTWGALRGLVMQFPLHCGHAKTCLTFAMPYSYQGRGVVMQLHEILVSVISAEDMELVHEVQNKFADDLQHAANTYEVEINEEDEERIINVESVFTCYREILYLRHTDGNVEDMDKTLKEIMSLCPILRLKYNTIDADSLNEANVMDDITMAFHRQLCLAFVPFHRKIGPSLVLTEEGRIEEQVVEEQSKENDSDIENSPPPAPKPAKKRKTRGAKEPAKSDTKVVVVGLVSPKQSPKPDKKRANKSRQKLTETDEEDSVSESPVQITNRSRRMSRRSAGDASINDSVRSGIRIKWTDEEAKCLIDGVKKHGYSNWADILADKSFSFAPGRTNVNLKDNVPIHGCNPALSKRCLAMINVYRDHLPLNIPTLLKFRLELHEILVSVISAEDMELVHEVQNKFADDLQHAANTYEVEINEEDEERIINVESVFTCYREILYLRHTDGNVEDMDKTLKEIMSLCPILRLKYNTIDADSLNEDNVMDDITMAFHRQLCLAFVPFHRKIGRSLVLTEEGRIEEQVVEEQSKENDSDIENSPPPAPKPAKKRKTRGAKEPAKSDTKVVVVGLVSPKQSPKPDKKRANKSRQKLTETDEEDSVSESPVQITNRSRRMSRRSAGDASINDSVRSGIRIKWTDEEAKCLIDGVKKHGYSNWADILADKSFSFAPGRTNVNLKDNVPIKCSRIKR